MLAQDIHEHQFGQAGQHRVAAGVGPGRVLAVWRMMPASQSPTGPRAGLTCISAGRWRSGNWTPEGFVGQMFRTNGRHVPPPPGMPSPVL